MDIALQNSVWVTSPEYAGWLLKRGFHWRKLWKRRWVALHGAELVYMDKEPTLENGSSLTMTKVLINPSTAIEENDIDGNTLGFMVHINDGKSPVWCLRADSFVDKRNWLTRLNHVIAIVRWLDDYEKVRVLGLGGTGIVYELLHKANERKFAMKEMEIKNKAQMQMALQEAEMLKDIMEKISHPNIIHIEKVFQVGSKFYLVFPLCQGGELYEHIIRRGRFTETDAALLTRDLVSGIKSLHDEDILHLDIKPENILFDKKGDDAVIKITDFGLSRVLIGGGNCSSENGGARGNSHQTPSMPTREEMKAKVVQLFERGIFNRDQLRGTVGYMSPELILTGYCSKGADIFAAGVVLYILLCGHPPFYSKSNREVLERTSRGQYTMNGPQWNDVSAEAKDLVEKMLVVYPGERATAKEVLEHPWLKNLPPQNVENHDVDIGDDGTRTSPSGAGAIQKGTGANLSGLRLLSGHVADRNAEKLASSLTRLVSSLQAEGSSSTLIRHVLGDSNDVSDTDMLILQHPDLRSSLSSLLSKVCDDGKISCESFLFVMKHFGIAKNIQSNVAGMYFCRFIDQDGDGFISADDIFTTQALVIQRSEVFLRAIFRIYSEAVWYPGRNLNIANYHRSPRKTSNQQQQVLSESLDSLDIVEPPKFITARHVGEIFTKIGLPASSGQDVFHALCIALTKQRKKQYGSTDSLSAVDADLVKSTNVDYDLRTDSFENSPNYDFDINADCVKEKEISSSPSRNELDSSFDQGPNPIDSCLNDVTENNATNTGKNGINSTYISTTKMDIQDFLAASEIDDVLVQALLHKPRERIIELLKNIGNVSGENNADYCFSEELVNALQQAELINQPTFAKSVGQATINVAVDVASKVADVTQNIFAQISEAAEGDESQVALHSK